MTLIAEVKLSPPNEDLASALSQEAKAVFEEKNQEKAESLQNLLDAFTSKVVAHAFEVYREPFDALLRLLRTSYGQLARFVGEDFRQQASFYLGQLHALGEVAHRLAHQRVPKEAIQHILNSRVSEEILTKVVEKGSVGASELARELNMAESNLSTTCKALVKQELLRRDRFGKRVRYSPTPLAYAVAAQLKVKEKAASAAGSPLTGIRAEAARAFVGSAADWPTLSVEAAAASFKPGSNVMANTSDFVSGLLTLAEIQGADAVAIDPPTGRVHIIQAKGEPDTGVDLPKSVSDSLSEQVKAYYAFSEAQRGQVIWKGQRLSVSSEDTPRGRRLEIRFIGLRNPAEAASKARVAFQELQNEKTRIVDFEKFYVRQLLNTCRGKTSSAAEVLGMNQGEFGSMIRELNIQP